MNTTTTLASHAVRARRFFYGPKETTSIAFVGSLTECKDFIARRSSETYHLSHNESGAPSYKIVTTNSLSPYARQQAEQTAWEQTQRA